MATQTARDLLSVARINNGYVVSVYGTRELLYAKDDQGVMDLVLLALKAGVIDDEFAKKQADEILASLNDATGIK